MLFQVVRYKTLLLSVNIEFMDIYIYIYYLFIRGYLCICVFSQEEGMVKCLPQCVKNCSVFPNFQSNEKRFEACVKLIKCNSDGKIHH